MSFTSQTSHTSQTSQNTPNIGEGESNFRISDGDSWTIGSQKNSQNNSLINSQNSLQNLQNNFDPNNNNNNNPQQRRDSYISGGLVHSGSMTNYNKPRQPQQPIPLLPPTHRPNNNDNNVILQTQNNQNFNPQNNRSNFGHNNNNNNNNNINNNINNNSQNNIQTNHVSQTNLRQFNGTNLMTTFDNNDDNVALLFTPVAAQSNRNTNVMKQYR